MHAKSRKSIEESITALDDWILTYASEWCDENKVKEARERIYKNGGTIGYIAIIRDRLENVLGNED